MEDKSNLHLLFFELLQCNYNYKLYTSVCSMFLKQTQENEAKLETQATQTT